jgi:tRNA A-37 threonylcarbamoyl transferase component Bud32
LCARCLLDVALHAPDVPEEDPDAFRIVTLLGRGADGTTYLAEQDDEPRFVSLKVLDQSPAQATRERLSRVRATLLDCHHPSLVRVVSVALEPTPAVACAYVQGRRVAAGVPLAREGFVQIAKALAYLHQQGVTHGNVRASNVLIVAGDGALQAPRWCLIDPASATRWETAVDPSGDLQQLGALMNAVVRNSKSERDAALCEIAARAERAGFASAPDLVAALEKG